MAMDTTDGNKAFLPETIGSLVVRPVLEAAVASRVGTVVNISSHDYRVPLVTGLPSAAWTAEAAEITPSDATFDELTVTPSKVAGMSVISRELAEDSSPAAQQIVGDGLARDISKKIDAAFFAATTTNGPAGLESLTTSTATYAVGGPTNTDWALSAFAAAEAQGGNVTSFVTDPATALTLATAKESTDSERNLLTGRTVEGVPLVVSTHVPAGTIWGIDSRYVQVVVRDNTRLEVDKSAYFSTDQVAVKATMRVGFAFTHPDALVKVTEEA